MILPEISRINVQALIVGVIFLAFAWLLVARANLKAELAQARADYVLCHNANAEWLAKTEQTNKAIHDMSAEAEARQAKAREAQEKAAHAAKRHMAQAQAVLAVQGTGQACRDAEVLIRQYIKDRK